MYTPGQTLLPAEWWPQAALLLAWPHVESDWSDLFPEIETDFSLLTDITTQHQGTVIICQDHQHQMQIAKHLEHLAPYQKQRIRYAEIPTNDTWCRDFGPIAIIKDKQPQLIDFQFNAWGERYNWQQDNQVNQCLFKAGILVEPNKNAFILEGGSIESDGAGTLLTTSHCLIGKNRNPGNRQYIEQALIENLPIERVLWLDHGELIGDDTDSHIDNLARFVSEDTITFTQCLDPSDEQYSSLHAMHEQLQLFKQSNGKPYQLTPLPTPKPCYSRIDQRRLPASYANFLIINNAVLVPQFNDVNDKIAIERLQAFFPSKRIIGIASQNFIEQNGGIHCLTMQLPAGSLRVELK